MSAGVGLAGLLPRTVCDVLQGGGTHCLVCVPDCFLYEVLNLFLERLLLLSVCARARRPPRVLA